MVSRRGGIALALLFFACLTAACGGTPKDAVAVWNGGHVTRTEAQRYFGSLQSRSLRTGARIDPKEGVGEILADLAYLKMSAAESKAAPLGGSVLHLDPRGGLLVQYYVERQGKRPHRVTDEEAMAVYKERLTERFTLPPAVTFRHVFLRADRRSKEDLAKLERTVLDGLSRGTPFLKMVKSYSESETARGEGKVGPVFRGKMDPAFEAELFKMAPKKVGVVRTPQGTHVVEILELRPPKVLPFEEVKRQIASGIMDRRNEGEREALMKGLREKYGVLDRTQDKAAGPDDVVLRVKDRQMTRRELDAYIQRRTPRIWTRGQDAHLRRRWVDDLVRSNLLYLDAVEKGMDREEAFVQRWSLREMTMRAKLTVDRRFQEWAKAVPDDEVRKYFEENKGRFSMPKRSQASYIFLPFGDAPPFELEQRIERLEQLAMAPGADPADLERRCAEAGATYVDMGWATSFDAAWIAPEFQRRFIAQTTPGSTGVFRVEQGLFVLLVKAVEPSRPLEEPADHAEIREQYLELRRTQRLREQKETVLKASGFKVLDADVFKRAEPKEEAAEGQDEAADEKG